MQHLVLGLTVGLAMAAALALSPCQGSPAAPGVAAETSFRGADYVTYQVSPSDVHVRLFLRASDGSMLGSLDRLAKETADRDESLLFAMNAGMFAADQSPLGLYVEDGQQLYPHNTSSGVGNFYLEPNGVFAIAGERALIVPTDVFDPATEDLELATQSGPMLLVQGRVHPAFREHSTSLRVRNGVGVTSTGELVFAISKQPVNFYDFALLFRDEFNCENALYLDGVVSSVYLPALGIEEAGRGLGPLLGVIAR